MDHPHELQLKPAGAPYMCSGCKELGFGPSYCCEKRNCSYVLHQECKNHVPSAFHPFFERSFFKFYEKAPGFKTRYCDACGKDVRGFVYHCSSTGYDLHPCCLKLKHSINSDDGNLTLKLSQKVPSKCAKCKHRNFVRQVRGWSYVSNSEGNPCYHVSCFKDLILENWKRGYFSQTNSSNSMSGSWESSDQLALTSMEMVQGSRRTSRRSRTMISRIAVMVFKLIFSAIFGNPISAIAALLEALASN